VSVRAAKIAFNAQRAAADTDGMKTAAASSGSLLLGLALSAVGVGAWHTLLLVGLVFGLGGLTIAGASTWLPYRHRVVVAALSLPAVAMFLFG
jgi:hypothetical protein